MTRFAQTKARFSFARIIGVFCAALVACVLALGVQTATSEDAFADESKSYSYTVTLYAGNGTIDGAASKSYGPYGYGKSCTIAWQTLNIQPDDDKYYVKGIRLAGHDGLAESGNIEVTQDLQYVVAYGMKKDQVAYTINYVDANGAQIADSETFYEPTNAYNLTGTLKGNAEDNVFTFKYQAVQGSSAGTTNGGASAGTTGGQATPGDENAATDENAAGDEATGDEAADETGTQEGAANGAEPAELLDIDDDSNPLASAQSAVQETFSNPLNYLPWVLGVLVVIALISVIALVVAKKRAGKDAS